MRTARGLARLFEFEEFEEDFEIHLDTLRPFGWRRIAFPYGGTPPPAPEFCAFVAGKLLAGHPGLSFEALEAFLEPPGVLLRASWSLLGRCWRPLVSPSPTAGLGAFGTDFPPFLFSTPYRTSTSFNLTPLNSTHLNSLFDPPRREFWSLLGPQIGSRSAQVAS